MLETDNVKDIQNKNKVQVQKSPNKPVEHLKKLYRFIIF